MIERLREQAGAGRRRGLKPCTAWLADQARTGPTGAGEGRPCIRPENSNAICIAKVKFTPK